MSRFTSKDIGQRFGIKDDDLKTPGHDALLLWAIDHAAAIVARLTNDAHQAGQCVAEKPVLNGRYTVGYWDLWISLKTSAIGIGVEIKTSIPSLGDLLRQLQTYQEYATPPHWRVGNSTIPPIIAVLSTDTRWRAAIEAQGFAFVDPNDFRPPACQECGEPIDVKSWTIGMDGSANEIEEEPTGLCISCAVRHSCGENVHHDAIRGRCTHCSQWDEHTAGELHVTNEHGSFCGEDCALSHDHSLYVASKEENR